MTWRRPETGGGEIARWAGPLQATGVRARVVLCGSNATTLRGEAPPRALQLTLEGRGRQGAPYFAMREGMGDSRHIWISPVRSGRGQGSMPLHGLMNFFFFGGVNGIGGGEIVVIIIHV